MRTLVSVFTAIAILGVGTAVAIACSVGTTYGGDWGGNAGWSQYHHKPGCGPWKSDGWAGGSGWHEGQPPKDHHRGDCPKPPCDHQGQFTGYSGSGGGGNNDCCDQQRKYSGGTYGGSGSDSGDCHDSSTLAPPHASAILE